MVKIIMVGFNVTRGLQRPPSTRLGSTVHCTGTSRRLERHDFSNLLTEAMGPVRQRKRRRGAVRILRTMPIPVGIVCNSRERTGIAGRQ